MSKIDFLKHKLMKRFYPPSCNIIQPSAFISNQIEIPIDLLSSLTD